MPIFEMIFQRLLIVKSSILFLRINFRNALFLITLLLGAAAPTMAGQEVARIPFINAPDGTAGLGAGFRFGESPYISSGESTEAQLDLIPLYLYEGKYLFAHGTTFGVHVFKNTNFSFSALLRARFQQLDPDTDPVFAGLARRHQTLDAGITSTYKGKFG
jgi:outer membrane protein